MHIHQTQSLLAQFQPEYGVVGAAVTGSVLCREIHAYNPTMNALMLCSRKEGRLLPRYYSCNVGPGLVDG